MTTFLPPGIPVEGGREYLFNLCPQCGAERKFYWNPHIERGLCFSGSCGAKVNSIAQLDKLLGGLGWDNSLPLLPNEEFLARFDIYNTFAPMPVTVRRRDPWVPEDLVSIHEDLSGLAYLSMKSINLETALGHNLMVSPGNNCIYAPLVSPDPSLPRGFMRRSVIEDKLKWVFVGDKRHEDEKGFKSYYFFCRPEFFYGGGVHDWIVLVEGVADVLRQPIVQRQGLAVCGSSLNEVTAGWIAEHCTEGVIVWGDNDAAGRKFYDRARETLRGWETILGERLRVLPYFCGEPDDDPGSVWEHYHIEELLTPL